MSKRTSAKKRWGDLSPRARGLILFGAAWEGALKAFALADIIRRPAGAVRGSKLQWALAVGVLNSGGVLPLIYLRYGRREVTPD